MPGCAEIIANRIAEEFGYKAPKPAPVPLPERYNVISGQIMKAAYQVHTQLGPGLLESVYEACMEEELTARGLRVKPIFNSAPKNMLY